MSSYTPIDDPSAYFQVFTYTGNGSHPRNLTNDGNSDLKPDLIWTKNLSDNGTNHVLANSTMGFDAPNAPSAGGQLATDSSAGINTPAATYGYVSAALTDGFTAAAGGTNGDTCNANAKEFVAWQWKANGGTTTSVSASGTGNGCVNACTHQANTTAGFSIITYTGRDDQLNNGQHSLLKHGLGAKPDLTILKRLDAAGDWYVSGKNIGTTPYSNNEFMSLNDADAVNGNYYTGSIAPTTTDIYLGNAYTNIASASYVMYAFAAKQGYSRFHFYRGNGQADGPNIFTGFKPAFVIIKREGGTGSWSLYDHKRATTHNPIETWMRSNGTEGESTSTISGDDIDLLSNGFKIRSNDNTLNSSGQDYSFWAWAENPFVTSGGTPTTAR